MRGVDEILSDRDADGVFQDRRDAAFQLADMLSDFSSSSAVVLVLPPEGVDVGIEVSRLLFLPLDAIVVRDIVSPDDPGKVLGAMAPDDTIVADDTAVDMTTLPEDLYRKALEKARQTLAWRIDQYRESGSAPQLSKRTVIFVTDGLAGPVRMLAAIKYARKRGASRIVVAVPTATARALEALREKADDIRCISVHTKGEFSVARAYRTPYEANESDAIAAFRMAKNL